MRGFAARCSFRATTSRSARRSSRSIRTTEVDAVKALAHEAIAAGFYNIDIDTSTLVDISKPSLASSSGSTTKSASTSSRRCGDSSRPGITISVGGEIGEVGTENSTVEELQAYMDGFNEDAARGNDRPVEDQRAIRHVARRCRARRTARLPTSSWISTRSSDSRRWRATNTSLAGAVQHGASTLPDTRVSTTSPSARRRRSISRRTSRTCCSTCMPMAARRDLRVVEGQRRRRTQGVGFRRAVLLQEEWLRQQQLAVGPVENVEKSVAVGLQQQLARLSLPVASTSTGGSGASQSCTSCGVNW